MIGTRYVCFFKHPHNFTPRRFVMIGFGTQLTDVLEEAAFPLPLGGI